MISNSKYWKKEDQKEIKKWFSEFLNWMQTSKNGIHEMKTTNNHGVWYDAQRLSIALFIDSSDLAKKIVKNVANRLDNQVDENGFFPAELERTISLHYTCFVMDAFFLVAHMSEKTGFDLWKYTSPSGKSLKRCFEVLKPYLVKEKNWEGQQIKDFDYEEGYDILMNAAEHFKCNDCVEEVKRLADEKAPRLRINLLYQN